MSAEPFVTHKECIQGMGELSAHSVDFVFADLPCKCEVCITVVKRQGLLLQHYDAIAESRARVEGKIALTLTEDNTQTLKDLKAKNL